MITKSEARKKWCPFARIAWEATSTSGSANRFPMGGADETEGSHYLNDGCLCIASDCMAWVWLDSVVGNRSLHEDTPSKSGKITFEAGEIKRLESLEDRRGYCGLAG